jgi:hypothetical protein
MAFFTLAFYAFVIFVIYKQAKNWLRWRGLRQWGEAQGCVEPATVPNYLPGGIERYIKFFMHAKGEFPVTNQ